MRTPRFWWRLPLMAAYGFIGVVHLAAPDAFLPIMPDWVPEPRLVVIVTGLCELAGVLGLAWVPDPALGRDRPGPLRGLRLPGQPQARAGGHRRAGPARQLVVPRPPAGVSAGLRLVGALCRRGHRLAVPPTPGLSSRGERSSMPSRGAPPGSALLRHLDRRPGRLHRVEVAVGEVRAPAPPRLPPWR